MLNKVIIMGRLTRDPEMRQTTSGVSMCRFSVAVDRQFKNQQTGEREADFISCVAWRQTAEFICRYFHKGNMILVEGNLRNDNYEKDGVKHYSMNVFVDNVSFCGEKTNGQGGYDNGGYQQGSYQQQNSYSQQGGYQQQGNYQQQNRQFADPQPAPAPRPAAPAQDSLNIGDIGEFEEILSDGEVPF